MKLAWQDHAVILAYLGFTLLVGLITSQRQNSNNEYFLAKRELPWWAIGLSIIATLLSSLTYLAEPGEVWKSGALNMLGKMMAIPIEMAVVWLFFIPFLMRFKFTSAYEYLEFRFNYPARLLGVVLFSLMSIGWMGFVVLSTSRALSQVTGIHLFVVISTVGLIATAYTVMGGMRAVVWTDVGQVLLMLGGGLLCAGFIASKTGSTPWDWWQAVPSRPDSMRFFDLSPFARSSVVTVALSMLLWHLCTHCGNQMTVQRYFSTSSLESARRSFVIGSLTGVVLNVLLMFVGLAILYFYTKGFGVLPAGLDPLKNPDAIFPTFMVEQLPAGMAGGVLAAVLAAAMSSLDSGINSLATVLCVEGLRRTPRSRFTPGAEQPQPDSDSMLAPARWITLIGGVAITIAAYALDQPTRGGNIVEMMARSFNCFTAPLGAMFLVAMFLPFVTGRAIVPATILGLAAAIGLAYSHELFGAYGVRAISFTWVIPGSIWVTALFAVVFSLLDRPKPQQTFGLTVFTQNQGVLYDVPLREDAPATA